MIRIVFFFSLIGAMAFGNLAWWRNVHRRAATFKHRRLIRIAAGLWAGTMFAGLAILVIAGRTRPQIVEYMPRGVLAAVYIWHFLFILAWVAWRALRNSALATRWVVGRLFRDVSESAVTPGQSDEPPRTVRAGTSLWPGVAHSSWEPLSSRRQFLAGAAMATPPVLATLAAWRGVNHLGDFRINTQRLAIPNLPAALDGLTIAHVTDVHIGKFTNGPVLRKIVEQTNQLRADLVLMTGDLIDMNLSDLPAGLNMVRRFDPRSALVMCEGNHDLFESREKFRQAVRAAGVPMPTNGSHTVTVNGVHVQLLGLQWGGPRSGRSMATSEEQIAESMQVLIPQIRPEAFPILLAHHPHAFDYIGDANVPLTLAGHTHGGQLNLPGFSPAGLRFRYLSGLYEKADKKLFVSNGVGNWFPLRLNAPAEIAKITLSRA